MQKKEFEERTGLTVSAEEYAKIEAVYMAAGEMGKDAFCAEWLKIGSSGLVNHLFEETRRLGLSLRASDASLAECRQMLSDVADFLIDVSDSYNDPGFLDEARWLLGKHELVVRKLNRCMSLTDEEREYIVEHLN